VESEWEGPKFDGIDEDIVEPLQEQINKTLDMFNRFKKY
jgi:hypothetical protein